MLSCSIDQRKAGQIGLQIESAMAFDPGFGTTVLGPPHAVGHQLNGGCVHKMDGALEAVGEVFLTVSDSKLGVVSFLMILHLPIERFGELSTALPIGM